MYGRQRVHLRYFIRVYPFTAFVSTSVTTPHTSTFRMGRPCQAKLPLTPSTGLAECVV